MKTIFAVLILSVTSFAQQILGPIVLGQAVTAGGGGGGTVAIDSTNWQAYQNLTFTSGATLSSFVVTGTSNMVMLACVQDSPTNDGPHFNTPTFNSVSGMAVKISTSSDGLSYGMGIWRWLNVSPVTASFSVSTTATAHGACVAWTLTSVNQTTPTGTPGINSAGGSNNISVTVSSAANHLVVSCVADPSAYLPHNWSPTNTGSTATRIATQVNDNVAVGSGISCSTTPGASSIQAGWTSSVNASSYMSIAVDVLP